MKNSTQSFISLGIFILTVSGLIISCSVSPNRELFHTKDLYENSTDGETVNTGTPTSVVVTTQTPTPTNTPATTPTPTLSPTPWDPGAGWTLDWSDEFDGATLDTSIWSYDIGYGDWGWGNGEWQYYSNSSDNINVADGVLTIAALCPGGVPGSRNGSVTSARINSKGKFTVQYGKIAARIKAPYGKGMWPAFWMLGSNIDTNTWPACGEIDIFEMSGPTDDTTLFTLHWDEGGHAMYGTEKYMGEKLSNDFHVYEVEWDSTLIRGKIDGIQYYAMNISDSNKTEFHQPFYILLNVAVGSETGFVSPPDSSTVWPQQMIIDWVRVYKN